MRPRAAHGALPGVSLPENMNEFLSRSVLKWASIGGGAITLFSNLSTLFNLADWARWIVVYWEEHVVLIWHWLFSLLGVNIPKTLSHTLTYFVFMGGLTVSAIKRNIISPRPTIRSIIVEGLLSLLMIIGGYFGIIIVVMTLIDERFINYIAVILMALAIHIVYLEKYSQDVT
jgi:hypothetical protein